ncbi:PaaX family transcriptional regulator C-terminal domain-containing protein [Pontiellaceae bacterium B1224]|nr:PaaX family transcriptional regulator C-terminal domain-containing protein [Pontiellaceae bacterium B1224]
MDWISFHHPDVSWPVVRRRAGVEFMELLELTSLFLSRGGWGLINRNCYPNKAAYQNATSRLRKNGLIIHRNDGAETPKLVLSDTGRQLMPFYFDPEKYWNKKWNGIWYLMMYDIPEVDKRYRNVLRKFLKRMRMGCLQKSVWVTPRDIRPDFDDLAKAASLDGFAYLFEARTVLGLPSGRVVEDAWNFDRLFLLQQHYCRMAEINMERLLDAQCSEEDLSQLIRLAVDAYHSAFCEDPLLPNVLLPTNYLGREALLQHRKLFKLIDDQLTALSSS